MNHKLKKTVLAVLAASQAAQPISAAATYIFRKQTPGLTVQATPTQPPDTGGGQPPTPTNTPAKARLSATLVAFDGVAVGSSLSRTVTVYNDGDLPGNWVASTSNTSALVVNAAACASVSAGQSCTVTLTYAPQAPGALDSTVTIAGVSVRVTGVGLQPAAELSTGRLDFGKVDVGATPSPQSFAVFNTGNTDLTIGDIQTVGGYRATTSCSGLIPAGQSCIIEVTPEPVSAGISNGRVIVSTSVGSQSVELSTYGRTALKAGLSNSYAGVVQPTGAFGDVTLGQSSSLTTYVLPIEGNDEALGVNAQLTGDPEFRIISAGKVNLSGVSDTCGAETSPIALTSCYADSLYNATGTVKSGIAVTVQFSPTVEGPKNAQLQIGHNGVNASPLVLGLSAKGVGTQISSLDKTALTWSPSVNPTNIGANSSQVIRLTNTGSGTVTLSSAPALKNADAAFTLTHNCGASLAPNASCEITVKFAPTSGSPVTGTVEVNTSSGIKTATLTGTGTLSQGTLAPNTGSSASFGNVVVNTTANTVMKFTNSGNVTLSGVYASIQGTGLSLVSGSNSCGTQVTPVTLSSGQSCTFTVNYTPTEVSTLTGARAQVISSAANSPATVTLTGAGVSAPDPNFGSVELLLGGDVSPIADASATPKSLTVNGGMTISTTDKRIGAGSMYFDGTDDYIFVADQPAFQVEAGDWTIEAWVRPMTTGGDIVIYGARIMGYEGDFGIIFSQASAKVFQYNASNTKYPTVTTVNPPAALAQYSWSHVALVRQGATLRYFVNGVSGPAVTIPSTAIIRPTKNFGSTSALGLHVGTGAANWTTPNPSMFKGHIDELRFTKGVARYTSNFTVPTEAFPRN